MRYQPLFTYCIKMSKLYYFFKNVLKARSEDNTFLTLLDLLESWIFQNYWTAILFIIFLVIIFEIILIKIYTSFQKKPVLPEKGSLNSQENEASCLKSKKFAPDNWSTIHPSLEERADIFSEGCTSSFTSEENEGNIQGRISSSDEVIWTGTNVSDYKVNHSCESYVPSSVGTSSSLSLFHTKEREVFLSHRQHLENECGTVQFSSKKLSSIMKTNKNKNVEFSPSDLRFSETSKFTVENEDLNVASCPPVHFILSRDQFKLLEENVRNQIPLKPKATLESTTIYLCSGSQESLVQNQHSVEMVISTQAQDSFPEQNAIQNQGFYEAQFTSQAQQLIHNQESVNSQPDVQVSYFAQSQDLMRKPFPSSTQDSFQAQATDKSQHFTEVPCIINTQDSIKGLESDEYLGEAQYFVWFEDSKEIKYSIKGQNSVLKSAEFLILTRSPNSVAEDLPQLKGIIPKDQQPIASSELNQCSVYGSMPLSPTIKGLKNRRKTPDNKSKLSLKVLSLKAKKTPSSQVFQITVCHISKNRNESGCEINSEKKELHQRKSASDTVLHLISVCRLITPDTKNFSRKKLLAAMTDLIKCGYFLQKQNKSPDTEKINYAGSVERGTSGIIKNVNDRENERPKNISPEMLPQLEQSSVVNTDELKASCSLLETDWKNRESSEVPTKQILDLHVPQHEISSEEAISEPRQKPSSSLKMESERGMEVQEERQSTENFHLQLSDEEEFPASTPDRRGSFPKENTKQQKDSLGIVLDLPDVSFLISGAKSHKGSEELEDIKIQVSTESVNLKQKKPLTLNLSESGDLSESEELERNTGSSRENTHQDTRASDAFSNATYTTISEPPDMEIQGRLKAETDPSTLNRLSHSALKQEKLPDEKKSQKAKYMDNSSIFKKPQQCDSEQEDQEEQEEQKQGGADPPLTQEVRFSIHLKPMPKYFKFEMEQVSSGSRKTQNKKQEVQSQTISTQTVRRTSPCPMTNSFQVEEPEQDTYRSTDRDSATDLANPRIVPENLPIGEYLIETTVCEVPFGGNLSKTSDDHIAEEKEDLKRDLSAVSVGPFEIRKILSDTKHVLNVKHVIMKVKKPAVSSMLYINRHDTPSHRKNWGDNFEIIIKQMLQGEVLADVLPDVCPHMSILPNTGMHSRLNTENYSHIKLTQEKPQVEGKEKYFDSIHKENESQNTLEPNLEDEVKGVKEAIPHDSWNFRSEARPVKKIKTEQEMHHPIPATETRKISIYSPRTDPPYVENVLRRLAAQTDFQRTADMELPPPGSGESLTGDTLSETKESNTPSNGSGTRETRYHFAEEKAESPKDLPAASPETSHSPRKQNRVKFANVVSIMEPEPIGMKTMKPPDHGEKSGLDFKTEMKKVNQTEESVTEYLNTLYFPIQRKLQEEFSHAQLRQGKLASKSYVDLFVKTGAFYDREEKVQEKEEEEQKSFLEAAPQRNQHMWSDACQMKELHLDKPSPPLTCLTQELPMNGQGVQHQTVFPQATLEAGLKMDPTAAEELQKTHKTESGIEVPVSPKAENLPLDEPKSGLDFKTKVKKVNQAEESVTEYLNTLYFPIQRKLQEEFSHAQLRQGKLASKSYVDLFVKTGAFYDREEKVQEKEEEEQKSFLEAAPQRNQHVWSDACQMKELHLDKPSPPLTCLTQELPMNRQGVQHQTVFPQATLEAGLKMDPTAAEELQKTHKTESDVEVPVSPKAENLPLDEPKSGLDFKTKVKKVNQAEESVTEYLNTLYFPIQRKLQEEFSHAQLRQGKLASKSYVDLFVKTGAFYDREEKVQEKEEKEQKSFLEAAPQHNQHVWSDACQMKELHLDKPSPPLTCLTQELPMNRQGVQHQTVFPQATLEVGLKMDPTAAEELQKTHKTESDIEVPVSPKAENLPLDELSNTATEYGLASGRIPEKDLDSYSMEENSEIPAGVQVTCLQSSGSTIMAFVSESKGQKKALKLARNQTPMSHTLRTMREIKPSISLMLHVRNSKELQSSIKMMLKGLQQRNNVVDAFWDIIHFTVPILSQIQMRISLNVETDIQREAEKLESCARFSPLKYGEATVDVFSTQEDGGPSDGSYHKEQVNGNENKETAVLDFYIPTSPTFERKRKFKQFSDMKISVNHKYGILKAKKQPISYMLNIKGSASPKNRERLGSTLTTQTKDVNEGKKMADKMYSSMIITPDINMYSKIETEKGTKGEKRFSSIQVKQEIAPQEGNMTSDDTKETNLQDQGEEESKQQTLLKEIPQHSQHFIFCSGQWKDLDLCKLKNQQSRSVLFVTEQDVPQQIQPAGPGQGEELQDSLQTQNDTLCAASSKPPLLKSEESPADEVLIGTIKCGVAMEGKHLGEPHSLSEEEKAEFKSDPPATLLESLNLSTPDLPESKRQRETLICRTLKSKTSPTCVIIKARKVPISKIFNIPQYSCRKNIPPNTLIAKIIEFLPCSRVLPVGLHMVVMDKPIAEKKKRFNAQELPETILESSNFSMFALPASEKERDSLKLLDKRYKMCPKCVTLKAKKVPISQTFKITGCGPPGHRRQFNSKSMIKQDKPVAYIFLNAICSLMPVSLDIKACNSIKETDMLWTTRPSDEQQEQPAHGERDWCACSIDKGTDGPKGIKDQDGEAAPLTFQQLNFNAHKIKKPNFGESALELKNSASKETPEVLTTAQDLELQQKTLVAPSGLNSFSYSILNSFPFEKLLNRAKSEKDLNDTWIAKTSSPKPGKSTSEFLIVTTKDHMPFERGPGKEFANSTPEGDISLQNDLQVRTLESFDSSMPTSSEFKVFERRTITRRGALSHRKKKELILENMAKETSQDMSKIFMNTFCSTPVSSGIKMHKKAEAAKSPLRKTSNITQLKQEELKRSYTYPFNKWSVSSNVLEGRQHAMKMKVQHEKTEENTPKMTSEPVPCCSQHFRSSAYQWKDLSAHRSEPDLKGSEGRQTQNLSLTAQEANRETHLRETILEPVSRHIMNFQVETVKKSPPMLEGIKCMVGLKALACGMSWDGNLRRKWKSPISGRKTWNQKDLLRMALKPLDLSSLIPSESKSKSYTLPKRGQKSITSPKNITFKAKQPPISKLLHITRYPLRGHRKKKWHNIEKKMREIEWYGSVREVLLSAIEDSRSLPPKAMIDKLSFDTAARGTLSNRTLRKTLGRHLAEEKAELQEHLAATFLGPSDFFTPVLFSSKSQVNTLQLPKNEIMLNLKCLTTKEKKTPISQVLKLKGYFTTKHSKKFESNLKTKMKAMWQGRNMTDIFPNATYFSGNKRQKNLKIKIDMMGSRSNHTQLTRAESPAGGPSWYSNSIDRSDASSFLKEAKLHNGESGKENQERSIKTGPFHMKNSIVNAHPIKEADPGKSEGNLFGEFLVRKSQIYEGNLGANVTIEKNKNVQENLRAGVFEMERSHICAELNKPRGDAISSQYDIKRIDHSIVREKIPYHLAGTVTDSVGRHLPVSEEMKRQTNSLKIADISNPKGMVLKVKQSAVSQLHNFAGHAAVNTSKKQKQNFKAPKIKVERHKAVLYAEIKSIYASMPILLRMKMKPSPSTRDTYEKPSEKRNAPHKANIREQQFLFRRAPQNISPFEFGAEQMRTPGPFESEAPLINIVCPKNITPQKTEIYLIDLEAKMKVVKQFRPASIFLSKIHALQIEKQKNTFKTANRKRVTNPKILALQKKQQESCVSGAVWSCPYAYLPACRKMIRHEVKAKTTDATRHTKQVKRKAKRTPVSWLLGYGSRNNKKELRRNIQRQKSFRMSKNVTNVVLKAIFDSGCLVSPINRLTEMKVEKDKRKERISIFSQRKLEKPPDERQVSLSGCLDMSSILGKLQENMREEEQFHQSILEDMQAQYVQPLEIRSQQMKKHCVKFEYVPKKVCSEPISQNDETDRVGLDQVKSKVDLEREVHPIIFSQNREINYSRLDPPRIRTDTKLESLIAQGVKQGIVNFTERSVSIRGESKKMDISLSSKRQDVFLTGWDVLQQTTYMKQKLLKPESISMIDLGSVSCPIGEPFHLENTRQVAKEGGAYINRKNISHLLGREGLKETDILIDSKGQKFHTKLKGLHKTCAVQRRCVKPGHMTKSTLDSVSSPNKDPPHLKHAVNTTRKQNSSTSLSFSVNARGKEKSELTGTPLKSNRQKMDFSKKLRAKQLNIYNKNKEMILESVFSCILHRIHIESTEKQMSTTAILQPKVLNPRVEKASNEVSIPVDQPPCTRETNLCIRGRKERQPERPCTSFPTSVTHPLMDICQIALPQIKKALKAVDGLRYHTSNTEKGRQREKCAFQQPASPFKTDLLQINIPRQQLKLDALNIMHHDYSTSQTRDLLKQMDVTDGYTRERRKGQNQKHLSISYGNFETHMSYPRSYPCLQTDLMPQTKEALSEMGNVSSRAKGLDLFSTDQLSPLYKYGLECTVPSITSRQMKKYNIMLPSESYSKTKRHLNHLFLKGKQSSDGAQGIKSISNSSSSKMRIRRKVELHRAIQKETHLPRIFLQSLSLCISLLHEAGKQKGSVKLGVRKDITCPPKGALMLDNIVSATDCDTPNNKIALQCKVKGEPGLVVTKTYEPIPALPYFKLEKEKTDGVISDNVKRTKQDMSYEEKDRVKAVKTKGITNPNITSKAGKSSLSPVLKRKELPLPLGIPKPQIKAQEDRDKSDVNPRNMCTPLPFLPHPHLNSSIVVGKAKPGILKSCLPSLIPQTSSNVRRVSFEEPTNSDSLSDIKELKCLPQKKEGRENMVDVKDIIGLVCVILKGKKSPLKQLLHRKEPQWSDKEQKKMMQEDKKHLDAIKNKPLSSVPSSPHLQWDPKIKEVYSQGLVRFCLPSLTLQELSDEMGVYEGPTNDILSSIKRGKDRVEIASEEIMHSARIALRVKQSSELQELQLKTKEEGEKMQEDKQVEIQSKSSISFLPSTEVDTRIKGDKAMQIKTRYSFLQPMLQESSPIGTVTCKKTSCPISNSAKNSIDHIIQKEEESVAVEKEIPMKKSKLISLEIQMDIKEQEKKLQKIKEEPDVVVTDTNTYKPSPSHLKLESMIEKADHVTEVTGNSLPKGLHQKSADTVRKASKEYVESNMTSGAQEKEDKAKILAKKNIMDPKDKGLEGNEVLKQDIPLNPKEQGKMDPQGMAQGGLDKIKEQEKADREGEKQGKMVQEDKKQKEMALNTSEQVKWGQTYQNNEKQEEMYLGGQEQGKMDPEGKSQEKMHLDSKKQGKRDQKIEEQRKMYLGGQEQRKMDPEGKSQEKMDLDSKEQGIWDRNIEEQGKIYLGGQEQGKLDSEGQQQGETDEEGKKQGKRGREGQAQGKASPESKEQEQWGREGEDQGKVNRDRRKQGETDLHPESKQPITLYVYSPPKSSLTDHAVERKDTQGIPRSAVSQLQPQKSLDAGKIAHTKSTVFDKPHGVKTVQEYKAQKVVGRGKIVDMKDITHPERATSETSQLPLPHVPGITSRSGSKTREQTNIKGKLERVQAGKGERDEILTLPSLPHGKLDKGIQIGEEKKRVMRFFLPHSRHQESSEAGKVKDTVSSLSDSSCDLKRAECMAHMEEDKANIFKKIIMYPKYRAVKAKESTICNTVIAKNLQVNITEQKQQSQEGSEQSVTLLSKALSFATSCLFKLDRIKEEDEPGTTKNDIPHSVHQESFPSGQVASTASLAGDVTRRKQCLTQEEDRVQTTATRGSMHPHDTAFKVKASVPPGTLRINEQSPLSKREEPQRSLEEKAGQKQERTAYPHVLTKICPSMPSPSYHGSSTSQIKLPLPPGTGKIRHMNSSEGVSSCNVTLKSSQHMQYKEAETRVKMEHTGGRILPKRINLRAETSPPAHRYNRRKLPLNIETQRKAVQEGSSKLGMVLRKTYASLPPPSCLRGDVGMNKQEGALGGTRFSFPPLKIQDVLDSDEKAYTGSVDSCMLSHSKGPVQSITQEEDKERLKIDIKDKNLPKYMDPKVGKLSLSPSLSTKELAQKIKEKRRKKEEDKNKLLMDLTSRIAKLSLSQLQFMESSDVGRKAHLEVTDGELSSDVELKEHMLQEENKDGEKVVDVGGIVETKDMYLKTKESPILDVDNLSELQCKTREQEEEVREVRSEPSIVLTKTSTALPNACTKIQEESTRLGTRSSFSTVSFQEPPDSKGGIHIKPVEGGILISLPKGKQHMIQKKEEDGTEIVKITMYPKHQEIKVPECKDEPGVVLTESLTSLPSLPHLKLDKKIELDDEMPRLTGSDLPHISEAGGIVPTESICGDVMKDAKYEKQHMPRKEEIDREKVAKRRSTEITLKSKKSTPSYQRHRTELHMNIKGYKQKEQEGPREPQDIVLRTIYAAKSLLNLKPEKTTQVDEEQLGNQTSPLLPLMLSALSDAEKIADTEAISGELRKGRQYMSHKGKRYQLKTVDMRIGVHCKEARISPVSHILNTKEFVLNMKVIEKKVHEGEEESCVVLTRTFLSIPSAPLSCLDLENKIDKCTLGMTRSSCSQQNLQDAQKTANRASVDGDCKSIISQAEYPVPLKEVEPQWISDVLTCAPQRNGSLRVQSRRDLSSQDENIYFPGFGTRTNGKGLGFPFTGQKAQPEICKKELFDSFHSYSTIDAIKLGNLKEKTELIDNLNQKLSPKVSVSMPRKTYKEICIALGTHLSSKGFSVPEREAHQREPSSKVSLGPVGSCKPERDEQSNERSRVFSPKVLATPTRRSLEKINIAKCSAPQNTEEQGMIMKKQVLSPSESGHKTRPNSVLSLECALQNGKQKMPLERDMDRKTTVYRTSLRILPRIHRDATELNATRGKEDPALLDSKHEECDPKLLPKSPNPSWSFLLQSGDPEGKEETNLNTTVCLEQKKLEMDSHSAVNQDEGKLEIDTDTAGCLEEDKVEMHTNRTVNLKKEKTGTDTSSTTSLHAPSSMAEGSQTETQANTHIENVCPVKEEHKEGLGLSSAEENTQVQKSLQRSAHDALSAPIPRSLKCQRNRLTVTDLKREPSPKYLTMKIPNDPVSQILDVTRHSTPSNRMELKHDFKKPNSMVSWGNDVSEVFIRNPFISMMSLPHTEETVESKTNLEREKQICLSKFQEKSTNAAEIAKRDTLTIIKGAQNFTNTVPQESQPLVVNEQQMQKLPHVKSKASLKSKTNDKKLTPQTKERIVPGHNPLRIRKEPDLHMHEQEEKIAKRILIHKKYPFMFEDGKEVVETHMKETTGVNIPSLAVEPQGGTHPLHTKEWPLLSKPRDWNDVGWDTSSQKVQQQKSVPGIAPRPPQVKKNKTQTLADDLSEECLFHIYEAITTVLKSQVKNKIQDKVSSDKLEKVQAHKPDDLKSPPLPEGPDPSSTAIYPKVQHNPILKHLIPEEKDKLTNHLESKALEIKLDWMPAMAKTSLQKLNVYPEEAISEENSGQVYPRFKRVNFMIPEGANTIGRNLECKCPPNSYPISYRKTLGVNGSSNSKEVITEKKSINKPESGASSVTLGNEITLPQILQNYSVKGKDKLLMHFSMKTLEIQMKAPPKIVRESCMMASARDRTTPLSNCTHSAVKGPKRKNRILLLFEEKSLRQIDLDLQYKYLRFLLGLSEESMFPKPNALPKHILKSNTISKCKKVDDNRESHPLSFDSELLENHISFKKQSPHERSLLFRKCLYPTHVRAFDSGLHRTVQKDTEALLDLKSHKSPENDKHHHVCFQETNTYKPSDVRTQENTTGLVDSHSTQISEDSTDISINIESLANLDKCPAPEVHDSEECMFIEANPYLNQESQNVLLELQKGIPLENLYKMKNITTYLQPLFKEDSGSLRIRACKKHSLIMTPPSHKSHKSRKYKSSSKMQSLDQLCNTSLNSMKIQSSSSSISLSEDKLSWTTGSGTSYSLAPLTESNIKLHLAKSQDKSQVDLESKERKKAKFDLFRKNNIHPDYNYSHTPSKEKLTRKKKTQDEESERSDYSQSKHRSASKSYPGGIDSHYESKENPPFFYACIPADSLEIIPQTVRWTIPQKTLRKRNFKVPMVANTSKSLNIWTSSKKLLRSLSESLNPVHQS